LAIFLLNNFDFSNEVVSLLHRLIIQ